MQKKNIMINLSLQTIYQVLSACMPLITAPYLARKLGANQLGIFSYTTSIVLYFSLFAMLGTVNYGTRSIAAEKNDREKRNVIFSSIYGLQICVTLTSIIAYGIYLLFICNDNRLIACLQGLTLISCLFDINWLFFGVEDFKITVTRSIIIKLLTVGCILLFIKNEQDLWIYTIIMLGSNLLSNMLLFIYMPKYASFIRVPKEHMMKHIKPNIVLFVPLLAMTVYHTMDKTMLGAMSNYEQSGFYYNSDKIVQIPLLIINGIGTVMLPRMTSLLAEKKFKEADSLFIMTMEGVATISVAIACGIAAVSVEFIPIFFGKGYEPCIILCMIFSPIILFKGFSVITRTQYLIPMGMEKEFTKSVTGGAIINLILNIILIPLYGAMGAVIATVIAELLACALQFYSIRGKKIQIMLLFKRTGVYIIIGLLMILSVRLIAHFNINRLLKLLLEIIVGFFVYSGLCWLYWKKTNNMFTQYIRIKHNTINKN